MRTGDGWEERVVEPLSIVTGCPYPAVLVGHHTRVIPLQLVTSGPISKERLLAHWNYFVLRGLSWSAFPVTDGEYRLFGRIGLAVS